MSHFQVARGGRLLVICREDDCDRTAAVRLYVAWGEDRLVCPPHARVLARNDGVVAEPLEDAADEWP